MAENKEFLYNGLDVSNKVSNKIDSLVYFIARNEELSIEDSLKKAKATKVYKKILDIKSFYWTMGTSTILNEYLREKDC